MVEKQRDANRERGHTRSAWRAIEFFAGIGGFACAWPECDIAAAIDIDPTARDVYQRHWPHRYWISEIGSLRADMLASLDANLWWLSPPCQPYSRRGRQCDVDDPRAASLLHLISLIPQLRPRGIALENVSGFRASRARIELEKRLNACGYHVATCEICPTELGWPNRRPRFYLLASLEPIAAWCPLPRYSTTLDQVLRADVLDGHWQEDQTDADWELCRISETEQALYGSAMDRVERENRDAVTACFGSSYGKSLLRAGSCLVTEHGWRRFTPREVARLLGYPSSFSIPKHLGYRRAWKLLGNSLSIPVVRYVLSHLQAPSPQVAGEAGRQK